MKIPFQVSARAGKLLGRENFSNPEWAIIELVKNAYDADAESCIVIFDIPDKKEKMGAVTRSDDTPGADWGSIYIIDNGTWMTKETIENHWMQIGTWNKETQYLSEKHRIKTGAKGIGRFALDRLWKRTEMWTWSTNVDGTRTGLFWEMDWEQFDSPQRNISEINADLEAYSIPGPRDKISELMGQSFLESRLKDSKFENGTIIKISNLKDDWHNEELKSVFSHLESLVPPEELNISFGVQFVHLQNPAEFGVVRTSFFNDFDYRVTANFNSQTLQIDLTIERDEFDVEKLKKEFGHLFRDFSFPFDLETIGKKSFTYTKDVRKILSWNLNEWEITTLNSLGDFHFSFHYVKFIYSKKEEYPFKMITNVRERKSTLERFGWIKIYRDSFRVRPYGDSKNDWLGLGFRAAKSPAGAGQRIWDWRVNNESLSWVISISRKTNPLLEDKSDRWGIQENEAFDIFKKVIIGVIHEFEVDRSRILNPIYLYKKRENERKQHEEINKRAQLLAQEIITREKAGNSSDQDENKRKETYEEFIKDSFNKVFESAGSENHEEIAQIRSLASLWLIVSSFSHELKEISNNASEIDSLEKLVLTMIPKDNEWSLSYKDMIDIFTLLKLDKDKIKHWVDYTLTTIRKDKRTRTKLDFDDFFVRLGKSWEKIFKRKDILLDISNQIGEMPYTLKAFEMDMSTVFSNLISNSIDSFEQRSSVGKRIISISFWISGKAIEIIFSDNGKGLDPVFDNKEDIFLPFTTSKKDRRWNDIGTGLGMYLVKSVIDDNWGDIAILEPKIWFSVRIRFPLTNY